MSGNFVHCKRERQRIRIVNTYNIHKVGKLISLDEHMTFVKHKINRSWNSKQVKIYDTLISDKFTTNTQ